MVFGRRYKARTKEITPIEDFTAKSWSLEFFDHFIEKPTLTPLQAARKGLTFSFSSGQQNLQIK